MHSNFDFLLMNSRHAQKFVPTQSDIHRTDAEQALRSVLRDRLARKRFFRLYHLRNLLFRLSNRLASRIAL